MFIYRCFFSTFILFLCIACTPLTNDNNEESDDSSSTQAPTFTHKTDVWVSAYLGAWNHYAPPGGNWGNLPTEEIDWDAFTQLIYFSLKANSDGSLSKIEDFQNFNPDRLDAIVKAAHNNGKPVLFTIGGWGNHEEFSSAISDQYREIFVDNLIEVMDVWEFDGIDLDLEPIQNEDIENYKKFVNLLHKKLQNKATSLGYKPMLTAATIWKPELFASLQEKFDQINLMTYDMSGAWPGWVSWHNAPVYSAGHLFPGTTNPLPSADSKTQEFLDAGVAKEKLGIGIDYYGYVWEGFVIKPLETWLIKPTVKSNIPYYEIMKEFYSEENYRWDDEAKAAFISISSIIPLNNRFISYDDEKSIEAKFDYVRNKDLGGLIIWELSGGYQKDRPKGERDILLQEVKHQLHDE